MEYMNTNLSPRERAELLLKELSLEEKVAQVNTVVHFDESYLDFDDMKKRVPYGIGEIGALQVRGLTSLEEVAAWQRKMQEIVMENSPHNIPAIFHMEGLCGGFIQDSTSFPAGVGRGCSFDIELEEKIGEIVSRQESACGIGHVLAPVLDVSRDHRFGRTGESYGEDPTLVAAMGTAYTKGIHKKKTTGRKTESVAKHFLGFHAGEGGIHGSTVSISNRVLEEIFGKPFQAVIKEAELKGIMPCYCTLNGEVASVSKHLMTDLLREKMGFDGVCFSDYGGISNAYNFQNIGESLAETGLMSMEAGMDIETPNVSGFGEDFMELFAKGIADIKILDRAVLRVLTAKFRMGLFENPFALQGDELKDTVINSEDEGITLQSARESVVMLKNDGVLPIANKNITIALIGPHMAYARKMFGGYTHLCMTESTFAIANSIAGVSGSIIADPSTIKRVPGTDIQSDEEDYLDDILKTQKPNCKSLLSELKAKMPDAKFIYAYGYPIWGEDKSCFKEALEAVEKSDLVIMTLGGKHGTCSLASMGEGIDATNINLPKCQDDFILEASKYGKPMIGVHFDGRPISSDIADEKLSAILECWSPAEKGAQAVTEILLGEVNPSGKLSVTVARSAGQIPIYYNHTNNSSWHQSGSIGFTNYVDMPHTPRYNFGYGLSYTEYKYDNLELSQKEILPDGTLKISCDISNVGRVDGTEIVQLYIRDPHASMIRPVKELIGFVRVSLKAGETKKVVFSLSPSLTAFIDSDNNWKIEKGEIEVQIGASSEDIRLQSSFVITEDKIINSPDRSFWANIKIDNVK